MAFNIYTWGDPDALVKILNAISMVFSSGDVQTFLTILVVATGTMTIFKAFFLGRDLWSSVVTFFVGTFFFLILFTQVKYDANVINERNGTASMVSDVPAPVVITAHFFSVFEKVFMDLISSSFQTPSGINYENSGYNYGAIFLASLPKLEISDPYFRRSFYEYVYSCFFEDILRKNKDFRSLFDTTDIWGYLSPVANVSTYYYTKDNPQGDLISCSDAYARLDALLSSYETSQMNNVLSSLLGVDTVDTSLSSKVFTDFLGQTTNNSNLEIFKNTISARYIFDTLQYAAADSQVDADVRSYAEQIAKNNVFRGWEIGGNNAREILPIVKSIIQLMLFAFFPFLLMMVFTPMRWMYVKMFLLLFFWLSLWDPLYSVATYVSNLRLEDLLSGVSYGQGYTLASMGKIFEQAMAHLSVWNYFALVVPMLAFALAKASENAMVSFASSIASSVGSGGMSLGSMTSTPQKAGHLMGEAQEISKYGSSMAYNRVAGDTFFGAEKSLGSVIANKVVSSLSPYGVVDSSFKKEVSDLSHGMGLNSPFEVGFAKAMNDEVFAKRIKEGIKQFGGDIDSYIMSRGTSLGIKDVASAKAFLNSIDKVFGDKDGRLTGEEIDKYVDFVKNKSLFGTKESAEKLGELVDFFKTQGYSSNEALLMGATFIGRGETAKSLMHSIKNRANLDALMKVSGYDLARAKQIFQKAKVVDFSHMAGKTADLIKKGREVFGEEAKGWSDFDVLQKMGEVFGTNSAQREIFENAQWDVFAKELAGSEDKSGFINRLISFASLKGGLDASAQKGIKAVTDSLGFDKLKKLVTEKTGGNFLRDIVEGVKNKDVISRLGKGNYERGLEKYADIMAEKEAGDLSRIESYLNEIASYYQKNGLSRTEALSRAFIDLGKVHAYSDKGQIKALEVFGRDLEKALASGRLYDAAKALGYYKQSDSDFVKLKSFAEERGMHEIAHAKALYELSGFLEELGLRETEANNVYQFLREGGGMLNTLSGLSKIAAVLGGGYLLKKFGEKIKDKFRGVDSLKNGPGGKDSWRRGVRDAFSSVEEGATREFKNRTLSSLTDELRRLDDELLLDPDNKELRNARSALEKMVHELQELNPEVPSDRKRLFLMLKNGEIDEVLSHSPESLEKIRGYYRDLREGLVAGYRAFRDSIMHDIEDPSLRERFDSYLGKIMKNPFDEKSMNDLSGLLKEINSGKGSKDNVIVRAANAMISEASKHSQKAGEILENSFGRWLRKGGNVALKAGASIVAFPESIILAGVGIDPVDIAVDLTTTVVNSGENRKALESIDELAGRITDKYGDAAGNFFALRVSEYDFIADISDQLGYDITGTTDRIQFSAAFASALYSYIDDNSSKYLRNGRLDVDAAVSDLKKVLLDKNHSSHLKYTRYFKRD